MCVVVCGVLCVWCVWCVVRLGMQKTPPCVDSKRLRVCVQDASVCTTHGRVFRLIFSLLLSPLLLSFSRPFFSLSLSLPLHSLSCSLPSLVFSLFSLSNNVNDHSSSALSLGTHGSNLPECQSACTLAHSLSGEHVRIMHETTVLVLLCKPRATWNEVGLYLCWKWVFEEKTTSVISKKNVPRENLSSLRF